MFVRQPAQFANPASQPSQAASKPQQPASQSRLEWIPLPSYRFEFKAKWKQNCARIKLHAKTLQLE